MKTNCVSSVSFFITIQVKINHFTNGMLFGLMNKKLTNLMPKKRLEFSIQHKF